MNAQVKELCYLRVYNNESKLGKIENNWKYYGDSIDVAFKALAYKAV